MKKLNIKELTVKSFTTSQAANVKGGFQHSTDVYTVGKGGLDCDS